ncbi:NADH:flavin oxidoreductase/NADH oxidase [Grosmannia clavigera kw1407]|uniref:NADH:flavin oxidoreductase/NADH oxidase n=1 Tax=Grosmannia clavigera (strain kw1407 / UAMH 11150) TaxID=655863 RepID=F0XDC3_GROCL|nr:NADH:flavin oxidoreductase/NADH oxidase [Grosmannia clavigera kw1407]EFX03865.1 NADH:flavin oxidoreductase/NADH oxidase [Grosmannia clavigera kw1407]
MSSSISFPTGVTKRGFNTYSLPAPGAPYYTPAQTPPTGTAETAEDGETKPVPTLFTPLTIRGVTLANRITVSPMCMYSADDGHATDFHLVHLGQFALRGAGLTFVEATSVQPNGRISPEDMGLWADSQVAPLRRIVDFVHAQGQKIGVQLAHAGRKASMMAPFAAKHRTVAQTAGGGWPDNLVGPSALAYDVSTPTPAALSLAAIRDMVEAFAAAARRAMEAGFDVVEIHGAHGYLLNQFLSPQSNKRTDEYGGSFENRTRLLFAVIAAVRAVVPSTTPVFVRVSATEWLEKVTNEPSWTVEDTIRLAQLLPAAGVDLMDVSSGGNSPHQKIDVHPHFQTDIAAHIRKELDADAGANTGSKKLLLGTVGLITTPELARDAVQKGGVPGGRVVEADLALVGRQFLRQPDFVLWAAHQLDVDVKWPLQYSRAHWKQQPL